MVVELRLTGNHKNIRGWIKSVAKREVPNRIDAVNQHNARRVRDLAKRNIRKRVRYHGKHPGWLEQSTIAVRLGKLSFSVVSATPYAIYVEAGTKPHFIPFGLGRPAGVYHPGARPMKFMEDAMNEAFNDMERFLKAHFHISEL